VNHIAGRQLPPRAHDDMMVGSNISDEAASTVPPLFIIASSTNLKSPAWADFESKGRRRGRSGCASAMCRWCDKRLCAGGRNDTSHLLRHSKRCRPAPRSGGGGNRRRSHLPRDLPSGIRSWRTHSMLLMD
jgi:hypothetical protein